MLHIADAGWAHRLAAFKAVMVGEAASQTSGRISAGRDDQRKPSRRSPTPFGQPGAGPADAGRILIVEDEWFIAIESEAVLREGGFEVVGIAVSAEEAVALAERHRPDLILMDIRLRGARDGVDAAREIRRRLDIACIFATAHSEPGVREEAEGAAPAGWLTKPFSDGQLLAAVREALGA